jgi:hypothetical protein
MPKKLACFALIVLHHLSAIATSVAIIRRPEKIIIVTDSEQSHSDGTYWKDVCKINPVGPLVFVIVGLGPTGVIQNVRNALRGHGTLDERLNNVIPMLNPGLLPLINGDPKLYLAMQNEQHGVLVTVIVSGFVGTVANVAEEEIMAVNGKRGLELKGKPIQGCPPTCGAGTGEFAVPAEDFHKLDEMLLPDRSTADVLKVGEAFVRSEIASGKPGIGGKIQAMEIDGPDELIWKEKPKVCK